MCTGIVSRSAKSTQEQPAFMKHFRVDEKKSGTMRKAKKEEQTSEYLHFFKTGRVSCDVCCLLDNG